MASQKYGVFPEGSSASEDEEEAEDVEDEQQDAVPASLETLRAVHVCVSV